MGDAAGSPEMFYTFFLQHDALFCFKAKRKKQPPPEKEKPAKKQKSGESSKGSAAAKQSSSSQEDNMFQVSPYMYTHCVQHVRRAGSGSPIVTVTVADTWLSSIHKHAGLG